MTHKINDPEDIRLYNAGIQVIRTETTTTQIFLCTKGPYAGRVVSVTKNHDQPYFTRRKRSRNSKKD